MNHSKTSYTYLNTASTLETTTTTTTTTTTLSESNNNNLDLDDQEIIMDTPLSPESSNNNYFFDFQNSFSMEQDSSEEMKDIEDTTTTTTALSNNNNINAYDSDVEDGEIFEDPETIIDTPLSPENSNNNNINNNNFVAPHLPPIFNTGNPGLFTISDDSFGFGYDQLWKQEPFTFDQMLVNTEVYNVLKKKAEEIIELEKKAADLEDDADYYSERIKDLVNDLSETVNNLKKISSEKELKELKEKKKDQEEKITDLDKKRIKALEEQAQLKRQATSCNLTELEKYFKPLGRVWLKDNRKYFVDSEGSQACCKVFLKAAFKDTEVLQAIYKGIESKIDHNNKNKTIISATNISFVLARLKGVTTCFVALARARNQDHDIDLIHTLDKFAKKFNEKENNIYGMVFSVITDVSNHYHKLIANLTYKFFGKFEDRNCSEYHLGAQIAKLYFEYGDDIQVLGVTNGDLYPFKEGVVYGGKAEPGTPESKIQAPRFDIRFTLKDAATGLLFPMKPCCDACKKNQFAMLAILAAVNEYKKQFIAGEKIENPFSPILARITKGTSTYQAFQALQSNHFFAPKDKKSLDGDTEGTKETKRVKRRNDDQGCRAESDATSNNNNVEEADNNTKRVKVTVK